MSQNRLLTVVLAFAAAFALIGGAIALRGSQNASGEQASKLPVVETYKTPTCGCCSKWVDHMRAAGFEVTAKDVSQDELEQFKTRHGVPASARSCHTALVGDYVIEGHVPASEVKRLLKDRQKVAGLAVPGMPLGSPGMEVSGVTPHPYDVLTIQPDGTTAVYSTIKPERTSR